MADQHTRRTVLRAAGIAGVAALAGCTTGANTGGTPEDDGHDDGTETHHDHGGHSHEEIEGPKASEEVRMITTEAGTHFDPHVVWVEPGATVTWVNESGSHSATAYARPNDRPRRIPEHAEAFDSGLLAEEGAEFQHTFEEPGVYDYYCTPHEASGMIGSVIVGEPEPHDQLGLAEAQESLPEDAHDKIHALNEQVNEALGHSHGDATETDGGHEDDGHHDATESDHHEEDGHHDGTATESDHHEDDGHHDATATETDHDH